MTVKILSSVVSGKIKAPPSKSLTHRAIFIASLSCGTSRISNWLDCDDTRATIDVCRALGRKIVIDREFLTIEGMGFKIIPRQRIINCRSSGTTLRFATAIAALSQKPITLTGCFNLRSRPIGELAKTLIGCRANISFLDNDGFPPVKVCADQLKGSTLHVNAKTSSQYVSAMLIVAPFFANGVTILISKDAHSVPYVTLTRIIMKKAGVNLVSNDPYHYYVPCGKYHPFKYHIEGDWTQASYFFAAAAITGGEVNVIGLSASSKQGDKAILNILQKMNCNINIMENGVTVSGDNLISLSYDMGNLPDIVQTVAVIAAKAKGETILNNIAHLKYKETDRLTKTAELLKKMGIKTRITNDSLIIKGGQPKGAIIDTYNDHRLAMSFAVLALGARGETIINNAEVVNKSYPEFWRDITAIGAKCQIL